MLYIFFCYNLLYFIEKECILISYICYNFIYNLSKNKKYYCFNCHHFSMKNNVIVCIFFNLDG